MFSQYQWFSPLKSPNRDEPKPVLESKVSRFQVKQFVEGEAESIIRFIFHFGLEPFNTLEALSTVHIVKSEVFVRLDSVNIPAGLNATTAGVFAIPAQFVVFKNADEVNLVALSEGSDGVDSGVHEVR